MDKRLELHQLFLDLGIENRYFQPPSSVELSYPAVHYSRSKIDNDYADNLVVRQRTRYTVIVMDEDPDSELVTKVSQLPLCTHDRHFSVGQLNHDVFTLYF